VCESKLSSKINSYIEDDVETACSINSADVKSAKAVFAAYCLLNYGTTSMPTQADPPGDMTYYITELPQFTALKSCAQDAVEADVMLQILNLCPTNGPEALASCVCFKDGVSGYVTSSISSHVRKLCTSHRKERLSSATELYHLYCSAAKGLTTLNVAVNSAARPTDIGAWKPQSHYDDEGPSKGVIVGAVVGSVLGALALGIALCFMLRRRRRVARAKAATKDIPLQDRNRPNPPTENMHSMPAPVSRASVDGESVLPPPDAADEVSPPAYEAGHFGESYAKQTSQRQ
jgi:hypothetical protein